MSDVKKKPRTYVRDFTVRLGPATVRGQLKPIMVSTEDTETKYCVVDESGNVDVVDQRWKDSKGNLYATNELQRAKLVEGDDGEDTYELVDAEALAAARESIHPVNIFNATLHHVSEVNDAVFPSNHKGYILDPIYKDKKGRILEDKGNMQWYDYIRTIVENVEYAAMAVVNVRNNEGLYRLVPYNGYIALQRQLYPEDLHEYPALPTSVDAGALTVDERRQALETASKLLTPFDITTYKDDRAERVRTVMAAGFDASELPPREAPVSTGIDMGAALEAFLSS